MLTASQVWTIIITTQEGRCPLVHPWSADLKAGVFVLYQDFEVEFGGDMERYLTFFTYQGGVRWKVELKTRSM